MIGNWMRSRGERPLLTTKTYNPMAAGADHGLAPERIERQLHSSLERLGVDQRRPLPDPRVRPRRRRRRSSSRRSSACAREGLSAPPASATTTPPSCARRSRRATSTRSRTPTRCSCAATRRELLPLCAREQVALHRLQPARRRLADRQVPPRRALPGRLADDPAPGGLRRVRQRRGLRRARALEALAARARHLDGRRSRSAGCSPTPASPRSSSGRCAPSTSSPSARRSRTRSTRPSATEIASAVRDGALILGEAEVTEHLPMARVHRGDGRGARARARAARREMPLRSVLRGDGLGRACSA